MHVSFENSILTSVKAFLQLDNFIHICLQAQHHSFPRWCCRSDAADTANLGLSYLAFLNLQRGQSVLPSPLLPLLPKRRPLPPPTLISLMSSATVRAANVSRQSHLSAPQLLSKQPLLQNVICISGPDRYGKNKNKSSSSLSR